MRRDYYAVLGIAATAAPREIRQAYRRLARQYSPDVNFWEKEARGLFDEIAEAYRVLSDPEARTMYDRFGHLVGAAALDAGRRGEDVHVGIDLAFADAARGTTVRLGVSRFSPCADCHAAGYSPAGACAACQGRGVRRGVDTVEVAVPAGVDSGDQVRARGEGSAGPYGGPRGDLVVSTRVREHQFFKRKGELVHCEVLISVWEALRGARLTVPTPFGETMLVVPPGTTGGQTFRLRGHGLARPAAGGGQGDLIVTVQVRMPSGLDARTEELVRELERLAPLAPREGLARWAGAAE